MNIMREARECIIEILEGYQVLKNGPGNFSGFLTGGEQGYTRRVGDDTGCYNPVAGLLNRDVFNLVFHQLGECICIRACRFRQRCERLPKKLAHPVLFFEGVHLLNKVLEILSCIPVGPGGCKIGEDLFEGNIFCEQPFEFEELE